MNFHHPQLHQTIFCSSCMISKDSQVFLCISRCFIFLLASAFFAAVLWLLISKTDIPKAVISFCDRSVSANFGIRSEKETENEKWNSLAHLYTVEFFFLFTLFFLFFMFVYLNPSHRCNALLFYIQLEWVFSCVWYEPKYDRFLFHVNLFTLHRTQSSRTSFTTTRGRLWTLVTDGLTTVGAEGGTRKVNAGAVELQYLRRPERLQEIRLKTQNHTLDNSVWTMPKQKCHLNQAYYTTFTDDLDTTSICLYGEVHLKHVMLIQFTCYRFCKQQLKQNDLNSETWF